MIFLAVAPGDSYNARSRWNANPINHPLQEPSVEVGQTQQSVEELHFSLYQRALHPELFKIDQVKRIEHRLYNVEIWITGLAHVVTVQFADQYLCEMIAPPSDLFPRVGLAHSFRFRGERDHMQTFPGGLRYILSTQVERMTPNLFPSTHRDLMRYSERRGMSVLFDENGHDDLVPLTLVDFEAREREFHVHAFHVFPAERTILKTQSIFEREIEPRRDFSD
jgi:Protein of unknown function DUF2617